MQTYYFPLSSFFLLKKIRLCFVFLITTCSLFGQLNVQTNKNNATYNVGESMTFNVTSSSYGQVTWVLRYDNNSPIISTGTFTIFSNQTKTIPYTSSEAGVVLCKVTMNGNQAIASAAFDPFNIQPFESEPSNFDSFWNNQKAQLANVPIGAVVTYYSNNTYSTSYRIRLNNINGRKVYGYLTIPDGPGPFPAIVVMPPYGTTTNLALPEINLAEQGGVISLSISIHNAPPDQVDPNAYTPDNFANENENYYRFGIMGGIRAIDYIFTRSDFDGSNLSMNGVSQGGGLATIIAGLDNRVKLLAISNPVLCQNSGLTYNRAGGFPNYVQTSRNLFGTASHETATVSATRYYDAMFFARRYNGPTLVTLSYEDETTPAATGFAAVNQLPGKKIILHATELNHSHPYEYWVGRFDLFRRFFPSTINTTPFPYAANTTGFDVNAGSNISTSGNSVNLSASIKYNTSNNPNYILKWEKISGSGNVSFSNSNNYNTTATFSSSGTYVLQFSGRDETLLSSESKFYTVSDRITITVGNGNGGDTTPPSVSLSTSPNNVTGPFTVNVNFSENVSGLSLNDFDIGNANIVNLSGSGSSYSFVASPISVGQVFITLPSQTVTDAAGNANTSNSNTLVVNYSQSNNGGCNTPTNLSINKNATQHSSQFNAVASRAVDGNTNGDFWAANSTSLTNWTTNAWWQVDLGETADINDVKIWNRSDCCQSNLQNYYVFVSNNPFSSTDLNATLSQSGVSSFLQSGVAGFPSTATINTSGRYVRIQLAGQGFLALAEVEVMGCFVTGNQLDQNITFANIPNKLTDDPQFTLNASSSSGLPVSFNIVSGPASIIGGNTVVLNGTSGVVTIAANQSGNGTYNPAPTVTRNFSVSEQPSGGCSNMINLAVGKPSSQEGTQLSASASRANDGNTNGDFWGGASVSVTNWTPNAWWQVDLGQVGDIEQIKIYNRTDCCSDNLSNYYVFVSDVPFGSTNLNNTINQNGVSNFFQSGTAQYPTNININRTGRYVRVQLQGTSFLSLAEVEVMGCFDNGPSCPPAGTPCNDNNANTQNDIEDGNCNCAGTPIGGSSCQTLSNVALNKNTTQRSTISVSGINGSASKAVDGNTNGTFFTTPASASSVTATQNQSQAWWQVDLGANYFIENINVFNRTDGADKSRNCYVLVSDTPFTSNNLNTSRNQADYEFFISGQVGSPSVITPNMEGRYVRVHQSGTAYLVLAEVQVMGCTPTNLTSNNTNTLLTVLNSEYLHVDVLKKDRAVELQWVTNTEYKNDFFIIEKSKDKTNFETMLQIDSKTDGFNSVGYDAIDEEPFFGKNYYRLLMTLKDGSKVYSDIFEIDFDVNLEEVSIFPNPTQDAVSISLKNHVGKKALIQIYDARGVLIQERKLNNINVEPEVIDLKNETNGLYLMLIKIDDKRIITRQIFVDHLD